MESTLKAPAWGPGVLAEVSGYGVNDLIRLSWPDGARGPEVVADFWQDGNSLPKLADLWRGIPYSILYSVMRSMGTAEEYWRTVEGWALNTFAESDWVLDAGIGPGPIARTLLDEFPNLRVVGVDLSSRLLGKARRNFGDESYRDRVVLLYQNMVKGTALPDESVDAALVHSVLTYLSSGDQERTLQEIHRVLKPNAPVLVDYHRPGDLRDIAIHSLLTEMKEKPWMSPILLAKVILLMLFVTRAMDGAQARGESHNPTDEEFQNLVLDKLEYSEARLVAECLVGPDGNALGAVWLLRK